MATISSWTYTAEGLNEHQDMVKAIVVRALVADKLLDATVAEQWARTHTVQLATHDFWRSLKAWISNTNPMQLIVVSRADSEPHHGQEGEVEGE